MFRQTLFIAALTCWVTAPAWAQEHGHDEPVAHEAGEHGDHAEEHAEEHAEDHGAHADHGSVSVDALFSDEKFIASLISFSVLALLIYFGARHKVRASLENRRREIEEAVAEARRREAEAEAKRKEFELRISQLDDEMTKIREEVVHAGEVERDRIVGDAEAKAALLRRDAKFQIEQLTKQLREDLTREAVEAAVVAAGEILAAKTTPADQQRLAATYLDEVAATESKAKEGRA